MRKRNISFIVDKLLWFIILILPLLFALVFTCASMNNYQLEVSASSYDDVYSEVRYDISYTSIGCPFLVNGYTYTTNVIDNIIYLPKGYINEIYLYFSNYFDEPCFLQYYSSTHSFDDDDNGYDHVLDYAPHLSTTSYDVYFLSTGFWNEVSDYFGGNSLIFGFSLVSQSAVGYCNYYVNVLIPQSDNIFKSYFANLNYSLDNWFTFGDRDIVYNAFNSIFGSQSNIMPIFVEGSFIPKYLTYMAWIYVLHLAFDFLVFIPRLAHKWMGGVYRDDE